ncbi:MULTISPECIES: universal stress protein [Acidobacterium]|uniref:Universal stress family protein n=1 Tax=Acidobacterium capsulatum (strain ATCC 51196 / DSM 11244 / BCRC 80197 / JCM 7670 / NBRC 15755 / NCIMB 13165 / 161) TaxID=240015 RepID=C1F6R8_ACIC5|nr:MULTISPECIES: universal stress protein [Acidobacterium]ACO33235.1 universal stress family protein [Acidobacterium capsulatum ATCC 51196]
MSSRPVAVSASQSMPHLETTPLHVHHILAATDFSSQATLALRYAIRLARVFSATLHILYCVPQDASFSNTVAVPQDLQEMLLERGRQQLHDHLMQLGSLQRVQHEEVVAAGSPVDWIAATARDVHADLIVMGSHGRGGLGKVMLGSVAEKTVRHIGCPVLVVGPQCTSRYRPLRQVVLAVEKPMHALRATQYACSITREFGATLAIAQVLAEYDESGPMEHVEEQRAREELKLLVPGDPELAAHVDLRVLRGDAAEELLHLAKVRDAGLVIVAPRTRAAFADRTPWSTLADIIRWASCPVLAVPPHLIG